MSLFRPALAVDIALALEVAVALSPELRLSLLHALVLELDFELLLLNALSIELALVITLYSLFSSPINLAAAQPALVPQEPWQTKRQLVTEPPRAFPGPSSSS